MSLRANASATPTGDEPRGFAPWLRRPSNLFQYTMLAPASIVLLVVIGIPLVVGLTMSFQNIELARPSAYRSFVGLDNYAEMLASEGFWRSLLISAGYTVGVVVGALGLGWGLALFLDRPFRGRSFVRAVMIIPWAIPAVAAALVWQVMLDSNFGILNAVLADLFGPQARVRWLLDTNTALLAAVFVTIWDQFPLAFVLILAGLQTVPRDLYEAAAVDGASWRARVRFIAVPHLRYVTFTTGLLIAIWTFRRFTTLYILTRGGPAGATETLVLQSYREAFDMYHLSYGATLGIAVLVISALFALVYVRATKIQ